MVKLIHKHCGKQMGWYLRDAPRDPDIPYAKDVIWRDGSKPTDGAVFNEKCPHCGNIIINIFEIHRDFDNRY